MAIMIGADVTYPRRLAGVKKTANKESRRAV